MECSFQWSALVRLIYEILDGKVGLLEGCSRLWNLADEQGLLSSDSFDKFVQLDSDFDNFVTGACGTDLVDRRTSFEASKKEEFTAELRLLLLQLQEPIYTLHYTAEAFMNGQLTTQQAILAMHQPIYELELLDKEPYATLYHLSYDFHEIPSGAERHRWHPELLERKEKENSELCKMISKEVKDGCQYILDNPIAHQY